MKTLSYAPEAWRYLNGIFCVYKPPELCTSHIIKTLKYNMCRDLNQMKKRPPRDRVELKGSVISGQPFSVEILPNYADHELVVGPRYQTQDVRITALAHLAMYSCGVIPMAINDGCGPARELRKANLLRKYKVIGKFGLASETFMANEKIIERATYSHIRRHNLDNLLATMQASHQALAYKYSGLDIQTQEAYELTCKGIVRPGGKTDPILYGIKCIDFKLPEFTLEIHCINETCDFLAELVHHIGLNLKSVAACTHLQRTQYGHLTLDHSLLRKHWTLENILTNISLCKEILADESNTPKSAYFDRMKVSRIKETIQNYQDEAREDAL